jgi:hypothetical protein
MIETIVYKIKEFNMNKLFTLSLVALLSLFLTADVMGQGRRRGHPKSDRKPEMEKSVKKDCCCCTCQKKVAKKRVEGKKLGKRQAMKHRRSSESRSRRLRTAPWKYRMGRATNPHARTWKTETSRWR